MRGLLGKQGFSGLLKCGKVIGNLLLVLCSITFLMFCLALGVVLKKKTCGQCGYIIRFQDHNTGVHNFDDHVLLTLRLLVHLRNGIEVYIAKCTASKLLLSQFLVLQNHLAVESMLNALYPNGAPMYSLRNGFLHFLALQDIDYGYNCVRCGYNPEIVIGDGNWKNACEVPSKSAQNHLVQF